MYDIDTFDAIPNFSVVVPNNCGAKCAFCFDKNKLGKSKHMPFDIWLNDLQRVVEILPKKFRQVSVTGGEPTLLDPVTEFPALMEFLAEHFEKVVVTTNGSNIYEHIAYMSLATYVNISYHGITNFESNEVFNANISYTSAQLKRYIGELKSLGTKVRIQRVYTEKPSLNTIFKYVDFAKEIGANDVAIRMDIAKADGLSGKWIPIPLLKAVQVSTCPVCADWMFKINDIDVHFKAGVVETNNTGFGLPYELIFNKQGKLTTSWNSFNEPKWIEVKETHPKDKHIGYLYNYKTKVYDGPKVKRHTCKYNESSDGGCGKNRGFSSSCGRSGTVGGSCGSRSSGCGSSGHSGCGG